MSQAHGIHAYKSGEISFLRRGARAENEGYQFIWVCNTYQPRVAVLTTPRGLELEHSFWKHVYVAGGSKHGDVLAGIWQVGIVNLATLRCFLEEPVNRRY